PPRPGSLTVVRPGGGFVVDGAGLQAAVQDADEPVGELAQGRLVADVSGSERVVVGAGAGGSFQRAEGPLLNGVTQAGVAGVAGQLSAYDLTFIAMYH